MRLKTYMFDFATTAGTMYSLPGVKVGTQIVKAISGQFTHTSANTAVQNAAGFVSALNAAPLTGTAAKAIRATHIPETGVVVFTMLAVDNTDELIVGRDNYASADLPLTDGTVLGVFNSEISATNQKVVASAILGAIAGALAAK